MALPSTPDDEITAIRQRLAALDAERLTLEHRLAGLLAAPAEEDTVAPDAPPASDYRRPWTPTARPFRSCTMPSPRTTPATT